LACSPFHVRFGKFSLLRPYEKKVEFCVNGERQDYAMKLGEGGEAFFVFETSEDIPEGLQTSPLVSPASSPKSIPTERLGSSGLQEPDFLDLSTDTTAERRGKRELGVPILSSDRRTQSDLGIHDDISNGLFTALTADQGNLTPLSRSPDDSSGRPVSGDWLDAQIGHSVSENPLLDSSRHRSSSDSMRIQHHAESPNIPATTPTAERSTIPHLVPAQSVVDRAISLSKKLSGSNIPAQVTDKGDIMLDMTGYKSSEEEALRAEIIARKILSEELEGNYDIGALIGADEQGNLWIYSSEEAKEAAGRKAALHGLSHSTLTSDAASDPGYQSDDSKSMTSNDNAPRREMRNTQHQTIDGLATPPNTPPFSTDTETAGDPNRNYAKTLRLTSDQLKALKLKPGPNSVSFSVNRATCQAFMYYWRHDVPIVISDIDGTITK
jgi:phosphatidate phosphatase LPIN